MNEYAEEILIGTILKDNSILDEITLSPEKFLNIANNNIYKAMLAVRKKGFPIDGASLKNEMGQTGFFFIGGNERLEEYKNAVASVHAFKSYEQIILNTWKVQTAKDKLHEVLNGELNVEKLQELIKDLSSVDEEGTAGDFDLKDELRNLYEMVMIETPKGRSGIPSGYLDIDNKTDGFQDTDLVIIGARPSMGKTAFILNLAKNAAEQVGAIPVIFSLETKKRKLLQRLQSCIAEVNGMKLKNPYHYTNDEEKGKLVDSLGAIEKMNPIIYDEPAQKVPEMRARIRKIKNENPGKRIIVFIDYLTKIKAMKDYKGNDNQRVTEIVEDLKDMAKTFDIPVVCLSQLSREVEKRQDKRPMKSDLRDSGVIEQEADIIMFLYRDEYYNQTTEENRNLLEVDIAKNRDGEVGPVKLRYNKDINKIENLYHYHSQKVAK